MMDPDAAYYENWQGKGLSRPTAPPETRPWHQSTQLAPQEEYMIDPTVGKICMGLGWDKGVDVDGSAALFDASLMPIDLVWWHKLKSSCKSVKHSGDDRTGEGGGDDEVISVDIAEIPLRVHHILFAVCIYSEGYSFSQLRHAYVRMLHGKPKYNGHVMCVFSLEQLSGRAMLMGLMTRKGAYWSFKALGLPATGHTMQLIVQNPANLECLQYSPSFNPPLRRVVVTVVQGAGLVARDIRVFGKSSSDPYFTIKFRGNKVKSSHIKKTLEPHWNGPPLDLGYITEAESKAVKVAVFDYDAVSDDDFMGSVWIPGSALFNAGPGVHNLWFVLGPGKGSDRHATVSGQILLSINVQEA